MSAKQEFFDAIYAADAERAASIWRENKLDPNVRSSVTGIGGHPALSYAVQIGAHELAREMIAAGADVNARGEDGATPIWQATTAEGVELLIAAGADIDARLTRGGELFSRGATALHRAAKSRNVELLEAMIRAGANVNAIDRDAVTPLHYAAVTDPANVRILLAAGADLDAADKTGNTPRSHIARYFPDFNIDAELKSLRTERSTKAETLRQESAATEATLPAPQKHPEVDAGLNLDEAPSQGNEAVEQALLKSPSGDGQALVQTAAGDYHYVGQREGVAVFAFLSNDGSLDNVVELVGEEQLSAHLLDHQHDPTARAAVYSTLTQAHATHRQKEIDPSKATESPAIGIENSISQASVTLTQDEPPREEGIDTRDRTEDEAGVANAIQPVSAAGSTRSNIIMPDAITRAPASKDPGISGEAAPKPATEVPKDGPATLLNGRFIRRENGEYFRVADGQESARVAFVDEAEKIRFVDKQMDAFQAAIELAKHKEWEAILVTGTEKFRSEAWYHAKLAGLEVVGYEPTEKDLATLAAAQSRIAELPAQTQRAHDSARTLADSRQAANDFVLKSGAGVQTPNVQGGRYVGRILHETEHHVVQDIGKKVSVVHEKSRLDRKELKRALETRKPVGLEYSGGRATLNVNEGRSRGQGLSR
ncbi:hypothetical protein FX016_23175 [Cupriavidus gilardii]|nr:hypothetical protein FX016_23175 [Cupriavidus gilardii]